MSKNKNAIKYKDFFRVDESPDAVRIQSEKKELRFRDDDAHPFAYDPKNEIAILGDSAKTHGEMFSTLEEVLERRLPTFKDNIVGGLTIWHKNLSGEELRRYLLSNKINRGIEGRIWRNSKVVSFWHNKSDVIPHIEDIKEFIEFVTDEDSNGMLYEFIDDLYGPKTLDTTENPILSDKEYADLMARQHIDPKAKKKLKDAGIIKASPEKAPEWKKDFQEQVSDELKMGEKEEMEHTNDPEIAKKIATDHLKEDPKYYTKLKKCMGESMKLTSILKEIIDENKEKASFELKNVYLNGRRIEGITSAYSESQALFNLIWRNLPESSRKNMTPIKVAEAKRLGGFKIKKIDQVPQIAPQTRLPYRDD